MLHSPEKISIHWRSENIICWEFKCEIKAYIYKKCGTLTSPYDPPVTIIGEFREENLSFTCRRTSAKSAKA